MKPPITQKTDGNLLMWRMVRAMEIPLPQAIRDGALAVETLSGMIDHCARCPRPGDCAQDLATGEHPAAPPAFCPNRRLLQRLRGPDATPPGPAAG